ncbi:MAG: DMT family transporter [Candidatus Kariarchaeaceae archaeon]|jgi:drug/metabolite transporter (DMT)-like permease
MDKIVPSTKSYILIFIAIITWGLSTPFIEQGLKYFSPLPFLTFRFLIASIILTPYVLINKFAQLKELMKIKWVWFIAFSETFGLIVQYLGQEEGIDAGLASLLSMMFILIVPFLSPWLLNVNLNKIHLFAVFIGLLGVSFISTEGEVANLTEGSFIGILLLLGAALGYAFYIATTSRLTTIEKPDVNAFVLFYAVLMIISISTAIISILVDSSAFKLSSSPEAWLWLLGLVIFSTLIAFLAYFEALKEISANMASILLLLQVIVPFVIDTVILKKSYSLWIWSGSIIIVLSMFIVVSIPYLEGIRTPLQRESQGESIPLNIGD